MPQGNAGWLTNSEANLFARVLEPAPAPNRRGASGFRALSFYTSELKAAAAIHSKLNLIANGQITAANKEGRTFKRYRNTLLNLGLIEEEGLALTPLGEAIRSLPLPPDVPQRAILIDGAIFRGLSDILRQTPLGDDVPRAPAFFAQLVLNARDFFDSIPAGERVPTVVDGMAQVASTIGLVVDDPPNLHRESHDVRNSSGYTAVGLSAKGRHPAPKPASTPRFRFAPF